MAEKQQPQSTITYLSDNKPLSVPYNVPSFG